MKKSFVLQLSIVALMLFATSTAAIIPFSAAAQTTCPPNDLTCASYEPLVGIPGIDKNAVLDPKTGLSTYFNGIFRIAIVVSGILAVIMIVIGGFEYITSEAMGGKKDGRDRITSAIGGLILLLFSYILLNTINPDITQIKINFATLHSGCTGKTNDDGTCQGISTLNLGSNGGQSSLENKIANLNKSNCSNPGDPINNQSGTQAGVITCGEGDLSKDTGLVYLDLNKDSNQSPESVNQTIHQFEKQCQNIFGSNTGQIKVIQSDSSGHKNVESADVGTGGSGGVSYTITCEYPL